MRQVVLEGDLAEQQNVSYISEWRGLSAAQKLYLPFKRLFDIVVSVLALIICAPLFLIVAIAIKLDSPGPVFFHQEEIGKDGKLFLMYKFRSMVDNAHLLRNNLKEHNELEEPFFKITNDPRVTRVGKVIRKYSIDELPQLINVLIGQMSLVGPRPFAFYEVAGCPREIKARRELIAPGLTCYWQVEGRSNITLFHEKMELDMRYIEELSPLTDIKILLKTVPAVISGDGAY